MIVADALFVPTPLVTPPRVLTSSRFPGLMPSVQNTWTMQRPGIAQQLKATVGIPALPVLCARSCAGQFSQ